MNRKYVLSKLFMNNLKGKIMYLKYVYLLLALSLSGSAFGNSVLKLNEVNNSLIEANIKNADMLSAKLVDIKSAAIDFHVEKNRWPTATELVSDGFYFGNFNSVYGTTIDYAVLTNSILLSVDVNDVNVAEYISSSISATNDGDIVKYQFGKPSQSPIVSTSLSRIWDGDIDRNTMTTSLYLGSNDINDVNILDANRVNSATGFYDNGERVFSPLNLPNKSDVGLDQLNNYAISHNYLSNSANRYASEKAVGDAYSTLFNKVESLTKGDIGLSNVPNYAATNTYQGNSTSLFITQRALSNAFNDLNNSKLGSNEIAVNSNLLDGLDSTAFARSNTLINGYDLTGNITLTKGDVGLGNVANYGVTNSYTGNSTSLYTSQKAVNDAWVNLNTKIDNMDFSDADTLQGYSASDFVKITRKINGKSLDRDITLTKSDIGLSNVANYGITDSYTGNSSQLYASQRSVYSAYQALNSAKLDKNAKANDSDRLDGIDSSSFVQTSRTINGKNLGSNITLSKGDIGLSNVANYSASSSISHNSSSTYATSKAVYDLKNEIQNRSTVNSSGNSTRVLFCDPKTGYAIISGHSNFGSRNPETEWIALPYEYRMNPLVSAVAVPRYNTFVGSGNRPSLAPFHFDLNLTRIGASSYPIVQNVVFGRKLDLTASSVHGIDYTITGKLNEGCK